MRKAMKAAALVAMFAIPGAVFAAQTAPAKKPAAAKSAASESKAAVSHHTTSGVVKSVSDSSLVITKGGKDQTFTVNASTEKKGPIETGAHVAVHYTMDGKTMVATAITGQPAKSASKSKGKK
jgi:hypothetical protein